ncbi:MAG: bifunctional phosphoribosyl-AMP cyclohydrolase/phosphoribosyl-ATP diphosphatase HisIE [Clostridia bacterium]|nr:bifunctional phosphoribosyl-AMP cyclohydrolase/phosphoribosyl-ATP diphosphatase HisIE [Clostridia bacterium]
MKPDFNKMKLIPAIIQDYKTKQVLMLAYVNEESYKYMLDNKQTCFFSRSRQKLWHKGESSGNFQNIKSMYLDCDNDTLLIEVEQIGKGACHTGSYSCFFNTIIENSECSTLKENNDKNIIDVVYENIEDRAKNPMENSYTNYLLNEGIDKICKKIGEEATETVIAAKNDNKEDFIGEICDLVYHTLVLMYNRKVNIKDIENKLKERHKIKGNKKKFNIRGEY